MKLKCLSIDDEPPALNILNQFIEKTSFLELAATSCNALEVFEILEKTSIDLLFLDVEMPDITGVELLKNLSSNLNSAKLPMVIFTTAYEQYALEGFELEIVDYLLKPIPFPRFLKATNKALKQHQLLQAVKPSVEDYLFVKADYQTKKIHFEDILYIEGLKDYVKIFTKNGMFLSRQNLKGIHQKLSTKDFIRIHKSYIVSFKKIDGFQKNAIFIGDKRIPIGEHYKEEVLKLIDF